MTTNDDFVSREYLKKALFNDGQNFDRVNGNEHFIYGILTALELIHDAPAAEVEPVRYGHWIFLPERDASIHHYWWECSECGKKVGEGLDHQITSDYCPRCGAKMITG